MPVPAAVIAVTHRSTCRADLLVSAKSGRTATQDMPEHLYLQGTEMRGRDQLAAECSDDIGQLKGCSHSV